MHDDAPDRAPRPRGLAMHENLDGVGRWSRLEIDDRVVLRAAGDLESGRTRTEGLPLDHLQIPPLLLDDGQFLGTNRELPRGHPILNVDREACWHGCDGLLDAAAIARDIGLF